MSGHHTEDDLLLMPRGVRHAVFFGRVLHIFGVALGQRRIIGRILRNWNQ
jgi:hypothetical protein